MIISSVSTMFLRRRGGMMVLVAMVMVVFICAAAFCVDVAYMHMVKSELRTAVDAASRAGTEALSRTQDQSVAVAMAVQIAERNKVAGDGLTLAFGDVVVGESQVNTQGKFSFVPGGVNLNAVSVVGARDTTSPDGNVGLFFGNVFGLESFEPKASSVAATSTSDIALVLDRSGSMGEPAGTQTRLQALVAAVDVFVQELDAVAQTARVSLTTYATDSTRDLALTENRWTITSKVSALAPAGNTNIFQGLRDGSDSLEYDAGRRAFADRIIIIMTDGNFNEGGDPLPSAVLAAGRGQRIHTITFGSGSNQQIMQAISNIGSGKHIHADGAEDLAAAFRDIAKSIGVILID